MICSLRIHLAFLFLALLFFTFLRKNKNYSWFSRNRKWFQPGFNQFALCLTYLYVYIVQNTTFTSYVCLFITCWRVVGVSENFHSYQRFIYWKTRVKERGKEELLCTGLLSKWPHEPRTSLRSAILFSGAPSTRETCCLPMYIHIKLVEKFSRQWNQHSVT